MSDRINKTRNNKPHYAKVFDTKYHSRLVGGRKWDSIVGVVN
jgi:hypothetical protein